LLVKKIDSILLFFFSMEMSEDEGEGEARQTWPQDEEEIKRGPPKSPGDFRMPPSPLTQAQAQTTKTTSRRSMLNIVRRQSKSMMAGVAFEDRVAAVDRSISAEERLTSLLRIALSATLRAVRDAEAEDMAAADAAADIAVHIQKADGVQKLKENGLLAECAKAIGEFRVMATTSEADKTSTCLLPTRVRSLRRYVKEVNEETDAWRRLMAERKEEYNAARSAKKSVLSGVNRLNNSHLEELGLAADDLLRPVFAEKALTTLREQSAALRMAEDAADLSLAHSRKRALAASDELDAATEKVKRLCVASNDAQTKNEEAYGVPTSAGASDWERRVIEWMKEVKKGPRATLKA